MMGEEGGTARVGAQCLTLVSVAFSVGLSVGLSAASVDRRAAVGGARDSPAQRWRQRTDHAWASLQVSHLQEHGLMSK
jgi:hypothetical protein